MGESFLGLAVDQSNLNAFKKLMFWDREHQHVLTTGSEATATFLKALHRDFNMAQWLYEANPLLLNARGSQNETLPAHVVRKAPRQALMRCGKFQNEAVDKAVKDWFYGFNETVAVPREGLVLRYEGPTDMLNWLLSLKVNFWDRDGAKLSCSVLDMVNDPEKYKTRFTIGGCDDDEIAVVKNREGAGCVLRSTFNLHRLISSGIDAPRIPITVEYHFEKLRQTFEQFQKAKEFDSHVSSEQLRAMAIRMDGAHTELKEHSEQLGRNARNVYAMGQHIQLINQQVQTHSWQIQSTEIGLKSLADNTRGAVETAQIQKSWDTLRQQIALDIPADTFARYLNRGLRKFVGGKELLGEETEMQRRIGFVEASIPGISTLIGNSVPVFGPFVGAVISGGAQTVLDWRADKLNDAIAAQFVFINKEDFCDRTALQITQSCRLFSEKRVKSEKDATKLAEYVLASLLYFLSCGAINPKTVKLEKDLREQIVSIFAQAMTCDNNQSRKALACKKYYEQLVARLESSEPTQKVLMLSNPASGPASSMNAMVVRPENGLGNYAASPQIQRPYPYTSAYNNSTNNGSANTKGKRDITPDPVSHSDSKQKKPGCVVM